MSRRQCLRLARLTSRLQDIPASRSLASAGPVLCTSGAPARPVDHVRISEPAASALPFSLQYRLLQTAAPLWQDVTIVVPSMGDSITEGTIAGIERQPGDSVKDGDVLAQIETDKVTIDVKYTEAQPGVVSKVLVNADDTVEVGQECFVVDVGASGGKEAGGAVEAPKQEAESPPKEEKKAEAPKKEAAQPPPPKPKPAEQPKQQPNQPPLPPSHSEGSSQGGRADRPERRVKMTRLRMRVADRLKGAQNTYAMLSTFNEIDMTGLMQLRSDYKDAFLEKHGVKLGFMSAFVKASAEALLAIPAVNGVIDGTDIIYRDYCDISIAVATPKGLVVPVLRDADKLDFAGVERAIAALGKKARDGTISIDDMAGGTFTISNGGVYGSMLSTPIINPPQSAILGMHAITQRAMVVGKEILPRPVMNVALTYDHRLIDGREAVTFLKRLKEVIEDPRRMLLGV